MHRGWQLTRALPSALQAAVAAVAGPALVTLLAFFPDRFGVASVALAYVLAVAAATALGGLRSGLAASLLSFVALHYFFTPPPASVSRERLTSLPSWHSSSCR